jgi:hypothetical protein
MFKDTCLENFQYVYVFVYILHKFNEHKRSCFFIFNPCSLKIGCKLAPITHDHDTHICASTKGYPFSQPWFHMNELYSTKVQIPIHKKNSPIFINKKFIQSSIEMSKMRYSSSSFIHGLRMTLLQKINW